MFDSDYRPIEALYLYISIFSPQGKAILDKLPAGVIANKDQCNGVPCPDVLIIGTDPITGLADLVKGRRVDLFEIYDAWSRPMRYAVKPPTVDPQCRAEIPASWELRSAGPDGKFAAMFTPEDQSDDVVLKGQ